MFKYRKTKIYFLTKNDIPFYIGKSINCVRRKHKHYITYGNDIKLEIIDECESIKSEWRFWEEFYIHLFKSWGFILLNKNNGGGGPTTYTEEQKKKMRKPHPGAGANISKTLKANGHSKWYTPEIKEKMSKALKGSHSGPFTDSHIENIKISRRKKSKRVIQYDFQGNFIKEWESKGQAAELIRENNVRARIQNVPSQIKDCCLGRMISCWGSIWRFKDYPILVVPKFKIINQFDLNKNKINQFKSNT